MVKKPIFSNDDASDPGFINIRNANSEKLASIRKQCEELWGIYEPYADSDFLDDARQNFDARFWEMYLTCFFIQAGYKVCCPKPGPDVGITFNGQRIWLEATCPTRGADENKDQVPERKSGVVQNSPEDQMLLRYLNSISEKYERQYPKWLENGIVKKNECFVIALNPRKLGFELGDTNPPRILKATYKLGAPFISLNRETGEVVGSGHHYRGEIVRKSGVAIPTGIFQEKSHPILSGLLCSRVDAGNLPEVMGADFQLVPNPNGTSPLPTEFRINGTYFRLDLNPDGCEIAIENWPLE